MKVAAWPGSGWTCDLGTNRLYHAMPTQEINPITYLLDRQWAELANQDSNRGPSAVTIRPPRWTRQCLKWSKKETGSHPQAEVECPSPEFFNLFLI